MHSACRLRARGLAPTLSLALLALSSLASADDFGRFGPYVGAGASWSLDLYENEIEDAVGFSVDVDQTWGANARLGLRLWSPLAVEVQYEWLSPYDIRIAGIDAVQVEQHVVTGNAKLYLPLWRVQPYLLAGVGWEHFDIEDEVGAGYDEKGNALAGRFGLGADVYLTRHLLVNTEASAVLTDEKFRIPNGQSIQGLHYLSVQAGLQYRF